MGFGLLTVVTLDLSGDEKASVGSGAAVPNEPERLPTGLSGRIAFQSNRDGAFYDYHPAWSPDGRRLVIASGPDKQHYKLFVLDADGANRRQLTFGGSFDTYPSWTR